MNLVIFATICLILGITSGELIGQMNDGAIIENDGLKKDLSARKLLYVVGVYPEWEKQITKFKKKWGEEGEKYLAQPNFYIHGDIAGPDGNTEIARKMDAAKITEKPTMVKFDVPIVPDSKKIYVKQGEYNEDLKGSQNTNINNFKRMNPKMVKIELPGSKQMNATEARRNEVARRLQDYQNFAQNIIKSDSKNPNLNLKEIKVDIVRKNQFNDDEKMEEKSMLKNLGNIGNGDKDILAKYIIDKTFLDNYLLRSGVENVNNNEDYRKYRNIKKIYAKLAGRKFDSGQMPDMSDTLEFESTNADEISPNYSLANQENEDQFGDDYADDYVDDYADDRKYTNTGKMHKTKNTRPALNFKARSTVKPKHKKTEPEEELKWIKQILIPRILKDRKYIKSGSDEIKTNPNAGNHNRIKRIRKSYPGINVVRTNNKNELDDNTNDAYEINDRRNLNSTLLNNREQINQRFLNREKQIEKDMLNTKFDDINEDIQ